MIKQILVGSRAFFSNYEDFLPADNDLIEFKDDAIYDYYASYENDVHIFHYRHMSKDEFLAYELEHSQEKPLVAAEFIVPEVAEFLNINIEDLFLFNSAFNRMTRKHKYITFIYNCYLENNSFTLSEEQLDLAYAMYNENK